MNIRLPRLMARSIDYLDKAIPGIRYVSLWIIFTLLMVLFPFVRGPIGSFIFTVVFSLIVISSILTVSGTVVMKRVAMVLMVLAVGTRWSFFFVGGVALDSISYIFAAMTLATVALLLFVELFNTTEVSSRTIWQAISVYLLLGILWACVYAVMEVLTPGSFSDSTNPDAAMNFPTLTYFSFVTLATLGYGDILPTTQGARGLIIIEVLTGVLYMAILISRLVGTWKPGRKKNE
jgi:hypothetical protein